MAHLLSEVVGIPTDPQVLLKAIEFLYRHWDLLPESQADLLRAIVLRSCYWKLLLHWSPAVRHFWCHLLAFRMHQRSSWSLRSTRQPENPRTPTQSRDP